ncbi:hypothetical protein J0X19_06075 [Hymenobacter sp. BT186]|uniref:O-antigen ligase domain-containing protein n=1 Tax=Hymenobacter telluris TaxID=2816474 RepID=A0A939JBP3_9BACT|nr:hypothetical protein [Hymenobacter telluris]MBW3373531.1 hypothetical protein [Hymenobacter norwichensis]
MASDKHGVQEWHNVDRNKSLKQGIWLYFVLLIFEGALRKWVLPGLSTPLLIIRDPVALWLVFTAWRRGLLPQNIFLSGMAFVGITGIYTAILAGHGNIYVALFGARPLLIHFPLIFVIGRVFNREDVLRIGKTLLWLVFPMTVLIALQFYSPQSAFVNRGVGGDMAGAGFGGAMDYFRPPGTFSFTNGTTLFYQLSATFILFFLIHPVRINRLVLVAATIGLLAAIPLSISRGLFFQVIVSVVFLVFAMTRNPKFMLRILGAIVAVASILILLNNISFFQTATEVFMSRFTDANEVEGGLVKGVIGNRYLGWMLGALSSALDIPLLGNGLGIATNVAVAVLTDPVTNSKVIGTPDEEWGRTIYELGPILGLAVVFIRVGLDLTIAFASYRKLVRKDLLPWMLLSFGSLTLLQAQWAQPTSLGFCTLIAGLMIASLRSSVPKPSEALKVAQWI